jgi:hypothetical protein
MLYLHKIDNKVEIVSQIKPLLTDMEAQGVPQFIVTPTFQRLCNKLDITGIYNEAYINAKVEPRDSLSEIFQSRFNDDLLGQLLGLLFVQKKPDFPEIITQILIHFLKWTKSFPSIAEIILDLESLTVSEEMVSQVIIAYREIEIDLLRQTQLLKDIVTERATGGVGDEKLYIRLRNSLIKNPISSPNLPVLIINARNLQEFWTAIKTARTTYQDRRQFINDAFSTLMRKLESAETPVLVSVVIDEAYIHEIWQKALQRITTDPEAAITSARTLVETVCRHIIEIKGLVFDEKMDLNKIYKTAVSQLNLSPEQHTQPVFKQILSGCQSVIEGLGSLRNKYSDAHGKGVKNIKPSARHAELAVNLAGSMCSFMMKSLKSMTP